MEETPVAPSAPEAPSEATPINSNPAPSEPAQAAPEAAPTTPTANIPADQIEAFNRFVDNNGGFEKAFATFKSVVSHPEHAMAPQPKPQQQREIEPQPQQQYSAPMPPDGFITQEEWNARSYFEGLSNEPAYASIADKIRTGDVLGEMAKFGIKPMVNGFFNDRQVRDFLNLYAKTVPATPTASPVTTTPTVDYVDVGKNITSRDDALKVLQQNMTLGKSGIASHPQTEAAKEFLKNYYKGKK